MIIFVCNYVFFNDTATTEIYTLSLHDALPIWRRVPGLQAPAGAHGVRERGLRALGHGRLAQGDPGQGARHPAPDRDRKSTRLNSSHANISYAVFCLKKKY